MSLLLNYLKRYKKILFLALALATINQAFSLLDPQIFRLIVDNYASKASTFTHGQFISGVLFLLVLSISAAFTSRVAKNFQDYYVNVVTQRVGTDLYANSVKHSFSLPYLAFEDQQSGALLSKLQKARTDSQTLITSFVNIIFLSLVGITFVVTYAFTVHWLIGVVYLLIIPVLGTVTFLLGKRIKAAQKDIVRVGAALAGSTTETIRNVELVKSLGLEEQEIGRLNQVNTAILGLELKKIRFIRALSFTQGTFVNAMRSSLLLLLLWLIFKGDVTLGQFFTLFLYSFFIFSPLGELGTVSAQYHEAKASMEQLQEVLRTPEEKRPVDAVDPGSLETIEFKNVSFSYPSVDEDAVKGVSLTVTSGETIAFVGPSGSGKSTLVKLLVGLYTPASGKILWNGVVAEKIDYKTVRNRVGLVLQETQLFAGTVRENLLFVKPNATDEECMLSLQRASAQAIFERTGQGLDTKIGEGGMKLSGGERQRLAIARALLRKPEMLIFDEATSSLDSITEKAITKTIQDIEKSHAKLMTVLVAHRLSTVLHARRIYVLEKGRVVETGSHDELLRIKGLYAALWREQGAHTDRV